MHRGAERHALKIINLKTNRVASPPQLTAVHIDLVDRTDFFGWTADGVLELSAREFIPQLTVLHLRSQGINLQGLRTGDFTRHFPARHAAGPEPPRSATGVQSDVLAAHLQLHGGGMYQQLAADWVAGLPRGWRQVEGVVDRLRNDFLRDRAAVAPADCPDVVSHFLESRRGPDYLFATTAAVMLRSLGYPTRLATGFYARRDRYERRAGQTAVLAEDVHVWAEVCVDGRRKLPFRPGMADCPPRFLPWRRMGCGRRWGPPSGCCTVRKRRGRGNFPARKPLKPARLWLGKWA